MLNKKTSKKGGMPTGMPLNSLIYIGGSSNKTKGGSKNTKNGGKGLVEQYFKKHNFPFASRTMGVNIVGHPIVTSLKQDENKAYTTILNKGGSKTKKKDSKNNKKTSKSNKSEKTKKKK